jgi:hypothetical protein
MTHTISDTEIIGLALKQGFMLTTAAGQRANKQMPVADWDTLVSFARELLRYANEE